MPRYNLRTLMIVMAIGPPMLIEDAFLLWWASMELLMLAMYGLGVIAIIAAAIGLARIIDRSNNRRRNDPPKSE